MTLGQVESITRANPAPTIHGAAGGGLGSDGGAARFFLQMLSARPDLQACRMTEIWHDVVPITSNGGR